jgi:hypothetical protein
MLSGSTLELDFSNHPEEFASSTDVLRLSSGSRYSNATTERSSSSERMSVTTTATDDVVLATPLKKNEKPSAQGNVPVAIRIRPLLKQDLANNVCQLCYWPFDFDRLDLMHFPLYSLTHVQLWFLTPQPH